MMPAFTSNKLHFSDFKKLALKRIDEAKILLNQRQYSGAFYLAGYSIEFALKACYCKQVTRYSFPPEKKIYDNLYRHDLNKLLDVSGIKACYDVDVDKVDGLEAAWGVVKDWNEQSRYAEIGSKDSESLVESAEKVLNWIKSKW